MPAFEYRLAPLLLFDQLHIALPSANDALSACAQALRRGAVYREYFRVFQITSTGSLSELCEAGRSVLMSCSKRAFCCLNVFLFHDSSSLSASCYSLNFGCRNQTIFVVVFHFVVVSCQTKRIGWKKTIYTQNRGKWTTSKCYRLFSSYVCLFDNL